MVSERVSRRRLIGAGSLAGLAALAPATVTATPASVTVIHTDDLAADCQRLYAQMQAAAHVETGLEEPIEDALGFDAMNAYTTAVTNHMVDRETWLVSELARHLPGLAPTIRMLASHIETAAYAAPGRCCTVDAGFEP